MKNLSSAKRIPHTSNLITLFLGIIRDKGVLFVRFFLLRWLIGNKGFKIKSKIRDN